MRPTGIEPISSPFSVAPGHRCARKRYAGPALGRKTSDPGVAPASKPVQTGAEVEPARRGSDSIGTRATNPSTSMRTPTRRYGPGQVSDTIFREWTENIPCCDCRKSPRRAKPPPRASHVEKSNLLGRVGRPIAGEHRREGSTDNVSVKRHIYVTVVALRSDSGGPFTNSCELIEPCNHPTNLASPPIRRRSCACCPRDATRGAATCFRGSGAGLGSSWGFRSRS